MRPPPVKSVTSSGVVTTVSAELASSARIDAQPNMPPTAAPGHASAMSYRHDPQLRRIGGTLAFFWYPAGFSGSFRLGQGPFQVFWQALVTINQLDRCRARHKSRNSGLGFHPTLYVVETPWGGPGG